MIILMHGVGGTVAVYKAASAELLPSAGITRVANYLLTCPCPGSMVTFTESSQVIAKLGGATISPHRMVSII